MKFRKLKKKNFVLRSYLEESFYVCKNGKLYGYYEWEYDNGLYTNSGIEECKATWKQVKQELSNIDKDFDLIISNGKCSRCGKLLTNDNYKDEIDKNHLKTIFETDYYYCNDCKQSQIDDFITFSNEYAENGGK